MAQTIRLRRGLESALPTTGLAIGEPLYTTDRYNVYVADSATSYRPLTPNLDELAAIVTPNNADLLMISDVDEAGHREKKITLSNFKTWLNIPAGSTDELVAATNGSTAGYLDEVVAGETGVISITSINAGEDLEWSIDAGGIGESKLANGAVTNAKLAATALNLSGDFTGNGVTTSLALAGGSVDTTELVDDAVTNAKLDAAALNLGAVFSGNGVTTSLSIATGGITTAMIGNDQITSAKVANTLLDLNPTTFSGTGIDTELDVAVIDGGSF